MAEIHARNVGPLVSSTLRLDCKGLILAPGELSRVPGALIVADNVNIEAPGIIRSRQGFARQANALGGPVWKMLSTKELGSNLLANTGSATTATGLYYGDGSGTWTSVDDSTGADTSLANFPESRMNGIVCQNNHYLTSTLGVKRMESDFVLWGAGMPKALGMDLTGPTDVLVQSGGFLADGGAVAYRHTWCKKDAEGIVMEGAPSGKTVVYNNAGTSGYSASDSQNVTCRLLIPTETGTVGTALTTDYFFKLYRSNATVPTAAGLAIPPSDDMALVYQQYLTSGDIAVGHVEITDRTTDTFRLIRGERLYTNTFANGGDPLPNQVDPTAAGIVMSNDPPPVAKDVVLFAECAFYGNISYRHKLQFSILSVSAGQGLQPGDVFTITPPVGSTTFTLSAIAPPPGAPVSGEFVVFDTALPAENTERTALNFCEAINKHADNDSVWAYYTPGEDSGYGSDFGKITLESRGDTGPDFTLSVNAHPTAYSPQLVGYVPSAADIFTNGIAYSKPAAADAVPPINIQWIGRGDTHILKMQVLRDSLYIFTDDGLYRLDGRTQDDFSINPFELSFRLLGPEMSVVCDDAIYAWGVEGFAKITGAGVEYISNSIEPYIWKTVNDLGLDWLKTYGFATAYRNRHKVMWAFPDTASNKNCKYMLVYDTRMQAWSRWTSLVGSDINATTGYSCGVVRVSDDFLYTGQWNAAANDCPVYKERRSYTAADYADDSYSSSNKGIVKIITWSATTPTPEMTSHWDELHIFYDVSPTITAWTTPTALSATFTADMASASTGNGVTPTALSRMSRLLVSQLQRRSARMTVQVRHTLVNEYFGLEGMALVYMPPEGTATVRT